MQIKQFKDKNLSHFSYAIFSDCEKEIMVIDPARNPQPYYDFANENEAIIIGVIETHPHADFISSHLEIHNTTGAVIYTSRVTNASYPHQNFDDGDAIVFGKIKLLAINTPGHSPDSICILLEHKGKPKAVFTGDTLFIGDCGRPDLREHENDAGSATEALAKQMYQSLQNKLMPLPGDVIVYPAHGAGTLCGKALREAHSSTMAEEKKTNWCLQPATEEAFVKELLSDQPFVPAYFAYDVALNKKGAAPFQASVQKVKREARIIKKNDVVALEKDAWIVDTRKESDYKNGHLPHSVNIMANGKFETWLGAIIKPDETFYLAATNQIVLQEMIERTAAIGYETNIAEAFVIEYGQETDEKMNLAQFKNHLQNYTIIDVRNVAEVKEHTIFPQSLSIPLHEIRKRINEVPLNKPVVVHCAGGYRSAAASSLIKSLLSNDVKVFDLGDAVKNFT